MLLVCRSIYDSRNYYGIIAFYHKGNKNSIIYDSRNYYGIIARYMKFYYSFGIYDSRNYYGIIAARLQRGQDTHLR